MTGGDLKERVWEYVDTNQEDLVRLTQDLVRIPSQNHPPTGDEQAAQLFVADYLAACGYEPDVYNLVEVKGLRNHPSYWPGRDYTNRPNVDAVIRGTGGGRSLLLTGHVDTVPAGLTEWRFDPFRGMVEDGRLYGLGSMDMKAGVAAILFVGRTLRDLGIRLKGDLILESVVDEEFGGVNGTIAGRLQGYTADACVITEPSGLTVWNYQRGGRIAHIVLRGQEGIGIKGSQPTASIDQLRLLLQMLPEFTAARQQKAGPALGNVWVTKVFAGGWGMRVPNAVPAEVKLELYWQTALDETLEDLDRQFFDWLQAVQRQDSVAFAIPPQVTFPIRFLPAAAIPDDHPLVEGLSRHVEYVRGTPAPAVYSLGPSDMFTVIRDFGIPAVMFGPGGDGAHSADEHVVLEDLITTTKALLSFVLEWCEVA